MFDPTKTKIEEFENGLGLLWAYTVEAEGRCEKDPILKHQVTQTYDYFNRIDYSPLRPKWEKE